MNRSFDAFLNSLKWTEELENDTEKLARTNFLLLADDTLCHYLLLLFQLLPALRRPTTKTMHTELRTTA